MKKEGGKKEVGKKAARKKEGGEKRGRERLIEQREEKKAELSLLCLEIPQIQGCQMQQYSLPKRTQLTKPGAGNLKLTIFTLQYNKCLEIFQFSL